MNYYEEALKLHEKHQGKIHTELNCEINTMDDMSVVYTPGVAEPCRKIAENEEDVYRYTTKSNTIAVVSNGTAVLGLGNIGAKASIPVMEGKAALFKKFGNVNAVPICLDTQDKEELIQTVKNIAPCFGGINLEDIASPDCFEIEERLDQMLEIPVFHDDQHGTAVVVLAALYNALRVTKKDIKDITVVLNGPGAAGTAIIKMMYTAGVGKIIAVDEFGILYKERKEGLIPHKRALCDITNPNNMQGTLADALKGADVFVGVSKPNLVTDEHAEVIDYIRSMINDGVCEIAPGGGFHTEEWYGHLNGGGVASVIMPLWYMGRFTDYCSDLDGKMAIYPIPVWNEGDTREVLQGGTGTSVIKGTENEQLAKDFLAFAKLSKEGCTL